MLGGYYDISSIVSMIHNGLDRRRKLYLKQKEHKERWEKLINSQFKHYNPIILNIRNLPYHRRNYI